MGKKRILDEDAISDDDTKSSSIQEVVKATPLKKKIPKPLPPNYVCGKYMLFICI
jgi:hypothetical protein